MRTWFGILAAACVSLALPFGAGVARADIVVNVDQGATQPLPIAVPVFVGPAVAAQLQQVTCAEPKRQFLVVNPAQSRFIDLHLSDEVIAVLRSHQRAQELFDRCRRQHPECWADAYLEALRDGQI